MKNIIVLILFILLVLFNIYITSNTESFTNHQKKYKKHIYKKHISKKKKKNKIDKKYKLNRIKKENTERNLKREKFNAKEKRNKSKSNSIQNMIIKTLGNEIKKSLENKGDQLSEKFDKNIKEISNFKTKSVADVFKKLKKINKSFSLI